MEITRSTQSPARHIERLEITPARREDMPTIAQLVRSSADWYRPFVDEKDMSEHDVDETWQAKNYERRNFYVGSLGSKAIGTISTQMLGSYAYLGYIYLDVNHVGRGHGGALMRFAEAKVRQSSANGMALIAHPDAIWAKKAYLKFGFKIAATEKEDVLAWQDGALTGYYEEGFQLYTYDFANRARN
jgi:GNAT superfamily N-acetyltransferase